VQPDVEQRVGRGSEDDMSAMLTVAMPCPAQQHALPACCLHLHSPSSERFERPIFRLGPSYSLVVRLRNRSASLSCTRDGAVSSVWAGRNLAASLFLYCTSRYVPVYPQFGVIRYFTMPSLDSNCSDHSSNSAATSASVGGVSDGARCISLQTRGTCRGSARMYSP
jgi:hypothetical protein